MPTDGTLFAELTPREQSFVLHPDVMTDPVKAAIDVGYAKTTAASKARTMRKQLMYYIRPLAERRLESLGVSLEKVRDEIAAIAFSDETAYFDTVDIEGDTVKVYKDPALLPEHMRRAIKSVTYTTDVDDKGVSTQRITQITLHDKLPALKELADLLGGYDPRMRTPGDADERRAQAELFEHLEPEELDLVTKLYTKALARAKRAGKKPIDGETA